jgi:hypothetical protein
LEFNLQVRSEVHQAIQQQCFHHLQCSRSRERVWLRLARRRLHERALH